VPCRDCCSGCPRCSARAAKHCTVVAVTAPYPHSSDTDHGLPLLSMSRPGIRARADVQPQVPLPRCRDLWVRRIAQRKSRRAQPLRDCRIAISQHVPMANESSTRTYSLDEVAAMVLPTGMKNGPRWLAERLRRGELSGYHVRRSWRMTHDDIEGLIERYWNSPPLRNALQTGGNATSSGLTAASRRKGRRAL
jgi:hypothetical protein